ncbi:mycorrhiza-induced NACHT/WD-repeat protein [Reticulomyxa filosa]|uniref:Mycorrhiza-induced NACHT/WD-repeat protein n=1 Tax=Reticulomyxa filosa TaxID=46433 RepID=X6M613_RETFI|nr:mycorrhiza-induced NACHT/WD-repeat protein [Reticulomyxa filosa]|eukprot:ETO09091.1 mycorrhiza-induced NACHT/WD-repeat protein [Reticulomyxa filosa]
MQLQPINRSEEEQIKVIIKYWIRLSNIKLGWINDFDKLIVNYVMFYSFMYLFIYTVFMLDTFRPSSKLIKTFYGHIDSVWSIDHSIFDDDQYICSGSADKTVRVWNVETNQQIQLFNGHSSYVYCVKFSQYHYHSHHRQNVICSSSDDNTIRFWDIKDNRQLELFNQHTESVCGIEFSSFNGGQYLCSGSADKTICLWDVETSKSLHIFNGHDRAVQCVDISPLQSNNNKSNSIGVIGGNGYTICSGSYDYTIRIWDIETTKQLTVFKGHESYVKSVKYGTNELGMIGGTNIILSGSIDKSIRLWDIRSGKQIQMFNGHTRGINCVEYSPFVIKNSSGISNVICSGSTDNTIRFWDIRSNNNELHLIRGNEKDGEEVYCLTFISLKKKGKNNEQKVNDNYCVNLCYGSNDGSIYFWG